MKFKIPFRGYTGKAALEVEISDDTETRFQMRVAIVEAVRMDADLVDADLGGADLVDADLVDADLVDADLGGADLGGADLGGADLSGANLSGANLREADLGDADLGNTNLSQANLSHANLSNTDLVDADLGGADLSGANLSNTNLIDAGQDVRGFRFVGVRQKDGVMISAGCRWLSLPEAMAHWKERHANDPALQAECLGKVKLIKAIAKARGPKAKTPSNQPKETCDDTNTSTTRIPASR